MGYTNTKLTHDRILNLTTNRYCGVKLYKPFVLGILCHLLPFSRENLLRCLIAFKNCRRMKMEFVFRKLSIIPSSINHRPRSPLTSGVISLPEGHNVKLNTKININF